MSVLIVLGLLWTAVLVPPVLRARANRRAEFIDSFRQQMGTLGSRAEEALSAEVDDGVDDPVDDLLGDWMDDGPPAAAPRRTTATQRRRTVLASLTTATSVMLLAGLVPALRVAAVVGLFLLDATLLYVGLLVRRRDRLRRAGTARVPEAVPMPVDVEAVPQPALDMAPRRRPEPQPRSRRWMPAEWQPLVDSA